MTFEIDFTTGAVNCVGGDTLATPPTTAIVLDHWKMNERGASEDEAWILEQLERAREMGATGLRVSVWFRHNSAQVGVN